MISISISIKLHKMFLQLTAQHRQLNYNNIRTSSFKREVDTVLSAPFVLSKAFKSGKKNLFYEERRFINILWTCKFNIPV